MLLASSGSLSDNTSAYVASIIDNVYGFQPVRKATPSGQSPAYRVSTQCALVVTHCDVEIDLGNVPGGTTTLAPGESLTVEYLVVPILPTYAWAYAIGPYAVVIGYYDGSIYHEQEIIRPCYSTEEGELNPVAWAKAPTSSHWAATAASAARSNGPGPAARAPRRARHPWPVTPLPAGR